MVSRLILYLPTLLLALIIVGIGWALAGALGQRVEESLARQGVPRAELMAGLAKAALLSVVGALALWELNFARQIVLAAFLIAFGAIGVAFALAVGIGSAKAIQDGWAMIIDRRKDGS